MVIFVQKISIYYHTKDILKLINYCDKFTSRRRGELQVLFILVDKSFDEVDLFECQLNGVQMLGLAGNVGRPELRTSSNVTVFITGRETKTVTVCETHRSTE